MKPAVAVYVMALLGSTVAYISFRRIQAAPNPVSSNVVNAYRTFSFENLVSQPEGQPPPYCRRSIVVY